MTALDYILAGWFAWSIQYRWDSLGNKLTDQAYPIFNHVSRIGFIAGCLRVGHEMVRYFG